jgi:membrane protein DedA with SNARE-associated domain
MTTDTLLLIHQMGYDRIQDVGYLALFGVMFIDGLSVPFVPIEIYLMLAGYLSALGILNIFGVFFVMTAGTLMGNVGAYLVGYNVGHQFFRRFGKYLLVPPERFEKLQALAKKYDGFTPFVFRFTPGIRPIASPLLGTMRTSPSSFVLMSFVALAIWNIVFLAIGYTFGLRFAEHVTWILPSAVALTLVGIVASFAFFVFRSFKKS